MNNREKFAILASFLFLIILFSVIYLFTMSKSVVNLAFSYVAGISMIVLPCTLPLAFVIVPLSMGNGYKKGFFMAVLFGLGLTITLSLYGIFTALIGNAIGLGEAITQASLISRVFFMIGGLAAFVFGLSELKLLKFELPSYGKTPKFVEKQKDYAKAFFMGLFLGNAGVGCPNPLFYVLLGDIALNGSVFYGALMGFVHGIGRATPLIFLSTLGIMGVNATATLMKHQKKVRRITGWFLILLGALIFIMGSSHGWYEKTFIHDGWNALVKQINLPTEIEFGEHGHNAQDIIPDYISPWLFVIMIISPIILNKRNKLKRGEKYG